MNDTYCASVHAGRPSLAQMAGPEPEIVTRVLDRGQRFETELRVNCTRAASEGRGGSIVPAALGAYKAVGCTREDVDGRSWLVVRLRRCGYV